MAALIAQRDLTEEYFAGEMNSITAATRTVLGVSQQSQKASLRELPKPGSSGIFLYRPTIGTTGTFGTGVSL